MLTSLHVLGAIPHINFVRDNSRARYREVESLLSKADFGADFVPTRLDTSIRDSILLTGNVRGASPATKLQASFDRLSTQHSVDAAERMLSETRLRGTGDRIGDGEGEGEELRLREESADVGQVHSSNSSGRLNECAAGTSAAVEGQQTRQASPVPSGQQTRQASPVSSGQQTRQTSPVPSSQLPSVDAQQRQQLGNQFPSDGAAGKAAAHRQKTDGVCDGFRDDLYNVPHSELLGKIQRRKQRARARPAVPDRAELSEALLPKANSSSFKLMVQKKGKTKGRVTSQSDYYAAGMAGVVGWDEGVQEEEGELPDEEPDDGVLRPKLDEPLHGK